MKIKRLTLTIEPRVPMRDLMTLKWKIEDGYKEFDYTHTLWAEDLVAVNDFKSTWDHIWEKAKFEIERELQEPVVGKIPDGGK